MSTGMLCYIMILPLRNWYLTCKKEETVSSFNKLQFNRYLRRIRTSRLFLECRLFVLMTIPVTGINGEAPATFSMVLEIFVEFLRGMVECIDQLPTVSAVLWTVRGIIMFNIWTVAVADYWGNVSLQLNVETNAKWWTVNDNNTSANGGMSITSFNQRIAPSVVISKATSYGYASSTFVLRNHVTLA